MSTNSIDTLRAQWTTLYTRTLPDHALAKSSAQLIWPVHLDHCFARIIYDAVIGAGEVPWTTKLKSPAVKNMTGQQLKACIRMGEGIASGDVGLVEADERSLRCRGKKGKAGQANKTVVGPKRKRETAAIIPHYEVVDRNSARLSPEVETETTRSANDEPYSFDKVVDADVTRTPNGQKRQKQSDIRTAMAHSPSTPVPVATGGIPRTTSPHAEPTSPPSHDDPTPTPTPPTPPLTSSSSPPSPTPPAPTSSITTTADLTHLITTSALTPFRRRVLLALSQVPKGQYTTYAAMSAFLSSSPRAVGNALRNNPFAPRVPCHRVLAADGGMGGFGGEWNRDGTEGGLVREKRALLRGEGVRFDGRGRVVGRVWRGFV